MIGLLLYLALIALAFGAMIEHTDDNQGHWPDDGP